MRLLEFQTAVLLRDVYRTLSGKFRLERVGGQRRVYRVGDELGVVYLVNGGPKGVGLTWKQGSSHLTRVYVWDSFNAGLSPDSYIDVPVGSPESAVEAIVKYIENPHASLAESAKEATLADFTGMIRHAGLDLSHVSEDDLYAVAANNGVLIPKAVLVDPRYRTADGFTFDAKQIATPRKVYIMAKDANGILFEVPGMDALSNRLEQEFAAQHGSEMGGSMEEQYEKLKEKVALVAGNRSTYIKSLLITGAPSSGKTFSVMETVKSLGLVEGKDYIVIKGSITDAALYQTFIEQIDALTIFDDCDSVAQSVDGKNMLKNALDTYAVRDIGRPLAKSINTKQMPSEERTDLVNAISRILRGEPASGDLDRFDHYLPKKKNNGKKDEGKKTGTVIIDGGTFELPDFDGILNSLDGEADAEKLAELQRYFRMYPPNRIDFRGRIIFISNMKESEWDKAILTRAFRQNMNFSDDEMMDFIEKIKDGIAAPQLSNEQKDEVLVYIRAAHNAGKLHSPINFRLIQQAFDLRLCSEWKSMILEL